MKEEELYTDVTKDSQTQEKKPLKSGSPALQPSWGLAPHAAFLQASGNLSVKSGSWLSQLEWHSGSHILIFEDGLLGNLLMESDMALLDKVFLMKQICLKWGQLSCCCYSGSKTQHLLGP